MKHQILLTLILFAGVTASAQTPFDLQGHRGCRGLMPENTIPAFIKAVDLGVNTIEMDVVITSDNQVVVSHEPYMLSVTCLDSTGEAIPKDKEKDYRIYGMTMAEVRKFDCGSKLNPGFPDQVKMKVTKPLLSEVFAAVEEYLKLKGLPPVQYNIEIKSDASADGVFQPKPDVFVDLMMGVITESGTGANCIIQSFDLRPLKVMHQKYPEIKTAILIANIKSIEGNLEVLGYVPEVYSPNYLLMNKKAVRQAHQYGMKIIPWTVNKHSDMLKMKNLGVDGLITDYPNLLTGN